MFNCCAGRALWTAMVALVCIHSRADEPGPTLKELLQGPKANLSIKRFNWEAVKSQMYRHDGPKLRLNEYILQISWFSGTGIIAYTYSVTTGGFCHNARDVYSHATQADKTKQLAAEELEALHGFLERLPSSSLEPPIERTVYVSFQTKEKWRTETYDASMLPDEFEEVLKITGERFETAKRHKKK